MQELTNINQLIAVAAGFERFVWEKFYNNSLVVCHPIIPALFFPRGLDFIPKNMERDVKLFNIFITSTDGIHWGFDYDEMVDILERGENFYIADFKLNVYISVEYCMLGEIASILDSNINGIISVSNPKLKWRKSNRAGELVLLGPEELG